jgi:hypothetical protein
MTAGHVYLVAEREFIRLGDNVYKVGSCTCDLSEEMNAYPRGSQLLLSVRVDKDKVHAAERDVVEAMDANFVRCDELGAQYYKGPHESVMTQFAQRALQHARYPTTWDYFCDNRRNPIGTRLSLGTTGAEEVSQEQSVVGTLDATPHRFPCKNWLFQAGKWRSIAPADMVSLTSGWNYAKYLVDKHKRAVDAYLDQTFSPNEKDKALRFLATLAFGFGPFIEKRKVAVFIDAGDEKRDCSFQRFIGAFFGEFSLHAFEIDSVQHLIGKRLIISGGLYHDTDAFQKDTAAIMQRLGNNNNNNNKIGLAMFVGNKWNRATWLTELPALAGHVTEIQMRGANGGPLLPEPQPLLLEWMPALADILIEKITW